MTDDLTTLLRDAGRGPTIDLDVDAVHSRGRRRAAGRRVAVGAGALALLGVLGAGVATLLDAPETPIVDQAPGEDGSDHEQDRTTPTAAMADLGVTVVDVVRSQDGAGGLALRVVTPAGVQQEFRTAAGSLPAPTSQLVVTDDLAVWFNDADSNLLVGGPADAVGGPGLLASEGVGWVVLGQSSEGLPLVTQGAGAGGELPPGLAREVFAVTGGASSSTDISLTEIPGISGSFGAVAGQPVAADAIEEQLALLHAIDDQQTVTLHLAGTGAVVMAETGSGDVQFLDVAIVDQEVWIVTQQGDVTNLWLAAIDGREVRHVATPVGRGNDTVGLELQVERVDAGTVAVLSTTAADGSHGPAYRVDVEAARAAASADVPQQDADVPTGVFDVLDAVGTVHLLPLRGPEGGPLAACANQPLNATPGAELSVWFLCWDAADRLPEDAAHPYVHGEDRFAGADVVAGASGIRAVLDAWAAGPTAAEAAAGLSGGLDAEVATIADVLLDGATVTVDLAAGPQVGVLSTTTGRATAVQAIVGTVLQFDGYGDLAIDEVVLTLDGSCAAWAELAQTEGCPTYDEDEAPWAQGIVLGSELPRTDLEDGRHAVDVAQADASRRWLTVDVVQWLTGDAAQQAYEQDTGDPDGPPNGYWIRDENDQLRTLAVADDVAVQLVDLATTGTADLGPATWQEFLDYLARLEVEGAAVGPFWLTLEDGIVTAVEEQYIP